MTSSLKPSWCPRKVWNAATHLDLEPRVFVEGWCRFLKLRHGDVSWDSPEGRSLKMAGWVETTLNEPASHFDDAYHNWSWYAPQTGAFWLDRVEDETGVSGTGRVAQGFVFDNGKVAISWLTRVSSVAIYDSLGDIQVIHGHGGKTVITWEEQQREI